MASFSGSRGANSLLLTLQSKCRSLTPFAHEDRFITEQDVSATDLLSTLEKCLFDGIRLKEFFGTFPFWYMLTLLQLPVAQTQVFQEMLLELAALTTLQTSAAKSRAFIRLALNKGGNCFENVLQSITQNKKLLEFFFNEKALLRKSQDASVLLALVRSLKVLRFQFLVDSRTLNKAPDWLIAYARDCLRRRGSITGGSSESLQTTLEKGVGYVFRRLDDVAQELLISQPAPATPTFPGPFLHATFSIYDYGISPLSGGTASRHVDPPLFGTPMTKLLKAESRCRKSHLARNIGVPNQLDEMLQALERNVHVKGLFRTAPSPRDVQMLRLCLENECGVPLNASPHVIASCLLQWLYELPEPLLGFDMYDAYLACQKDIESEVHRIRNFALLVESAPWYNKPTLHRVVNLILALSTPESSAETGLNSIEISNLCASFLLRSATECPIMVREDSYSRENLHNVMRVTAACGPVTEILVKNAGAVFKALSSQMQNLQDSLNDKVANLTSIQAMSVQYISDVAVDPNEKLFELWTALTDCEIQIREKNDMAEGSNAGEIPKCDDPEKWLNSDRWKICFPHDKEKHTVLDMFDILPGGLLAIQCLCTFLKLHPSFAERVICNFAARRSSACSLAMVCLNLVQMCLVELRLVSGRTLYAARNRKHRGGDEDAAMVAHISMEKLARLPSWHLLSNEESFADFFGIALQIFDDLWKIADPHLDDGDAQNAEDEAALFKNCMIGTRILLNELQSKTPSSSEDMYKIFIDLRISREAAVIEGLNLNHVRSTKRWSDETDDKYEHDVNDNKVEENSNKHKNDLEQRLANMVFRRQPCILTADQIEALAAVLPQEMRYSDWNLKYNLLEDGASISTLVRKCKGVNRSILVIQDTEGVVFGCILCDDEWKVSYDQKYYGSGTVRVFTFKSGKPEVFKCTLANSYFLFASPDCIGVGGGGDGFAIYLDQDLNVGNSYHCETFDSPCLASSTDFVCMTCNVYSVEMS